MKAKNCIRNITLCNFFLNYKSTGMNITNYVVAVFKYEIIIDIQLSLKKTALYPVLISEIPGTFFSLLTCHYQL